MTKLFIGGIRSGKSKLAEDYCRLQTNTTIAYIATARMDLADECLKKRIQTHVKRRKEQEWSLFEADSNLQATVDQALLQCEVALVDSIDMWLASLNFRDEADRFHYDTFVSWFAKFSKIDTQNRLVIVSSEIGLAPVAAHPETREFVDRLGTINQILGRNCNSVSFCVAGLEHFLK